MLISLNGSKREEDTGKAVGKWLSSGRQRVDTRVFARLLVTLFDGNAAGTLSGDDKASGHAVRTPGTSSIRVLRDLHP